MATKPLSEIGAELTALLEDLEGTGFKGPKMDSWKRMTKRVIVKCGGEVEDDDIQVIDTVSSTNGGRRRRAYRPAPPGTFQHRERKLVWNGKTYRVESIAHAFCTIADTLKKGGKLPAEEIAEAIQAAYPENNYKAYRPYVDWDKYVAGVFGCQRREEEDAGKEADI